MPFNYTWLSSVDRVADDPLPMGMINKAINNCYALKERFEQAHVWSTGKHKRAGMCSYGTLHGDGAHPSTPTRLANSYFNMGAAVTHDGTGRYTIPYSSAISYDYGAAFATIGSSAASTPSAYFPVCIPSTAGVTILIYNAAGALSDLSALEYVSYVVYNSCTSGSFSHTWVDMDPRHLKYSLGDDTWNALRTNLYAIAERWLHKHFHDSFGDLSTALHREPRAIAYGTIKGSGDGSPAALVGADHNLYDFERIGVGKYRFFWAPTIVDNGCVIATIGHAYGTDTGDIVPAFPVYKHYALESNDTDYTIINVFDTSGTLVDLSSNQLLSVKIYGTIAPLTNSYTWAYLTKAIPDIARGYSDYNDIRNDLLDMREIFEHRHHWSDGTHKDEGALGVGCLVGTAGPDASIQSDMSFNLGSISYDGVGIYTFTWLHDFGVDCSVFACVSADIWGNGDSLFAQPIHEGATTTVVVVDESGTPQSLTTHQYLSVSVYKHTAGAYDGSDYQTDYSTRGRLPGRGVFAPRTL